MTINNQHKRKGVGRIKAMAGDNTTAEQNQTMALVGNAAMPLADLTGGEGVQDSQAGIRATRSTRGTVPADESPVGVKGTGSYGARAGTSPHRAGVRVVQVNRPARRQRRARVSPTRLTPTPPPTSSTPTWRRLRKGRKQVR
jgi:hypothetical protein